MKIGSFTKLDSGVFVGKLKTLTLDKEIELVAFDDKANDKAPDYQVFHSNNGAEIGAGWNKTSKSSGNPYINIKIDDPTFAAPLWCALTKTDEGDYNLYWTRSENGAKDQNKKPAETL